MVKDLVQNAEAKLEGTRADFRALRGRDRDLFACKYAFDDLYRSDAFFAQEIKNQRWSRCRY